MHRILGATALAGIAGACVASAALAAPSPQFVGAWTLDVSKMPPGPAGEAPPKSVTLVTKEAGGRWTSTIEIVGPDGKTSTQELASYTADGSPTPFTSDPAIDTIVVTSPDPNTLVLKESKAGKLVQTETIKLSADGKQQVVTAEGVGPDGKPASSTETWNRK
jgi:hypothetical protein